MYDRADAADVICFAGAEEALYLAMNVLLDRGDHAVVVTPNYQAAETVPLALCEVTGVALDPDRDWALHLDAIRAAIRPNTRVVSVNFPNNPTGKVIGTADFTELARLCDERGIHLFTSDARRLNRGFGEPGLEAQARVSVLRTSGVAHRMTSGRAGRSAHVPVLPRPAPSAGIWAPYDRQTETAGQPAARQGGTACPL
ncbi:aminotransferase class I/II-fold pyridoxal phosphate-dependent enzyme [Streptomyces sp. NPDC004296]|uniref:aminotransferase class I/II-fold pyridoxal phosphate-dependent enzyme n=1 Tax=Streptomyces sp. NPDC004296 TaxID=3364697 RepID=UPI0036C1579C